MSNDQPQAPPPIQPLPPSGSPPPPPTTPPAAGSPLSEPERQARLWNMLCHLSALSGYVGVPLGNIWMPLLIWQIKKYDVPSVEFHGKAAFNFQLTVLLAIIASIFVAMVGFFFCIGHFLLVIPFLIGVAGLILPIINGIKANNGEDCKYPYAFDFFK
jgi:uncharacterized Tic20 family protein